MNRPVIALLTDFGTTDPFVGVMKGVILSRCAEVTVVDVTHAVPAQAVDEAAFWLERSFRSFPPKTIFVAVVDPGVGTARRGVVAEAHGCLFVAPDNGVVFPTVSTDPAWRGRAIDVARLGLGPLSRTFHGRDVFAPVAAELAARRLSLDDVGPPLDRLVSGGIAIVKPAATPSDAILDGVVVTVDHFGNLISNLAPSAGMEIAAVEIGTITVPVAGTYAEVAVGGYAAIVNAFDVVEVARRDGNAAVSLGIGRGASVRMHVRTAEIGGRPAGASPRRRP